MKTLDLSREQISVEDLLKLASGGSVRVVAAGGQTFVIEEADDFEKEVELLSKSRKFQRFLEERSKEPATTSLEEYRASLE